MSKDKSYSNPNGEFTEEELIEIKKSGKVDEFLSKFRLTEQPCPPKKLRPAGGM